MLGRPILQVLRIVFLYRAHGQAMKCRAPDEITSPSALAPDFSSRLFSRVNMFDMRPSYRYCVGFALFVFTFSVVYFGIYCPEKSCAFSSHRAQTKPLVLTASRHHDSNRVNSSKYGVSDMRRLFGEYADTDAHLQQKDITANKPTTGYVNDGVSIAITTSQPLVHQEECDMQTVVNQNSLSSRGSVMYPDLSYSELESDYQFHIDNDRDILVFLHIQKTGGTTFGRHLVKNLDLSNPCVCFRGQKRCDCMNKYNHIWLFSRYSTGWKCGLHADWTELTSCVNSALDHLDEMKRSRRFLYITMLREPYDRYLSEFKHVRRGATWKSARLMCSGEPASLEHVPFCYKGEDWEGVSLEEFMACPHNLANNRQTRMLANLSLSGCYDPNAMSPERRACIMLQSAKTNLARMAFLGLTEYQRETQLMFENTFGLRFVEDFFQHNRTHARQIRVTEEQQKQILSLNALDIELYRYARQLFFHRFRSLQLSASFPKTILSDTDIERAEQYAFEDEEEEEEEEEDDVSEDEEMDSANHIINQKRLRILGTGLQSKQYSHQFSHDKNKLKEDPT